MFALTKVARNRRSYIRNIRRLVQDAFGLSDRQVSEQNRVWGEWLGLKRQECRDLIELLKLDVKDVFKARALAILLAPRISLAPFEWSDDTSLNDYLSLRNGVVLAELSPQLRDLVMQILEVNIDVALAPDADEDLRNTLYSYNALILQALALLGEDDPRAARLFSRYQINDPIEFYNMDDASGYNPLRSMFLAEVPERWKKLADEKMREVVRAEQEGKAKPRRDWEKALRNYTSHIQLGFYGKRFPYSTALFASQVEFVLSLPNIAGRMLFETYHARRILQMLSGENLKSLRHLFAIHVVLIDHGEHEGFRVYNEDNLTSAEMMLQEFGGSDKILRKKLEELIAEGKAKLHADWEYRKAQKAENAVVMAQMR